MRNSSIAAVIGETNTPINAFHWLVVILCLCLCLCWFLFTALVGSPEGHQEASEKYVKLFVATWSLCERVPLFLLGRSGDFSFRFRVKLYPVSATYIFDEVTRCVYVCLCTCVCVCVCTFA